MKTLSFEVRKWSMNSARMAGGVAIAVAFLAPVAWAQTQIAEARTADPNPTDLKPVEPKLDENNYQTFYLASSGQQSDANDIITDLRNMLPRARVYFVASQNAISIRATPEDSAIAKKILAEVDKPRKVYRLTYTITESESGKPTGTQHFSLIVPSGGRTELTEGTKVPIVTGTSDAEKGTVTSQVQYEEIGLKIQATLEGVRLHTKVEQSALAGEKSGAVAQDPTIRQTVLDGMSTLSQGKPVVLGSLDVPGSTRHQEIEVASELVQ
jgi:type II secretory pathway component GspD/PulD (secretin)